MNDLKTTGEAFVEIAHRVVWCTVASVDRKNRPRSRILHPIWAWEGDDLVGYVATVATPLKRAHIEHSPYLSMSYWAENQDTCVAEVGAEWIFDDAGKASLWQRYLDAPAPLGYDPAIIEPWAEGPQSEAFAGLKLTPWALRVIPGGDFMHGFAWKRD